MIDYDFAVKVEKEVAKKYGNQTITNPKSTWNVEKEKEYLEQARESAKKLARSSAKRVKLDEDVLIDEKLVNKNNSAAIIDRTCPDCGKYSFVPRDDVYFKLFGRCYVCSIRKGDIK